MEKIIMRLQNVFGYYPFSVISTNIFAVVFGASIAWLCFKVSPNDCLQQAINVLIAILGALVGWALGMFFAPFSENEAARFTSIGQAISVFVSGYAISKLDRFLEATMFQDKSSITIAWIRFGLLFCSMLLVMLTVFSNRSYFRADPTRKKTSLQYLDHAVHAVQSSNDIRQDNKVKILSFLEELRKELEKVPIKHTSDAEVVAKQASDLADEYSRLNPRQSVLCINASGLIKAAESLNSVVPTVTEISKRIETFVLAADTDS